MGSGRKSIANLFREGGIIMELAMIILWILFIVITIIIELETSDLVTVWFTVGAVGALISAALDAKPLFQIGVFLVISMILLLSTRPLTKNMMRKGIVRTNADKVIGMVGVVTKNVMPHDVGEVTVDNVQWRATNLDGFTFLVGEKVSIDAISGTKLIISKINHHEDFSVL
jgi:membrane protein implicated in regulation of membrane protease activity